ncbi:hypothetical protein [Clostridium tagluense]|uniref:hypothetical protein n=1 Tax=Clostridium tagluense TaxID=360422 RepID=UPI001C6EAA62|nr:hypothetical protein [Clostridium tagluense]MBW9158748.1 hypothetical protein [Clostridium tagluense]WLC67382.1 hypothetical protein KTC93_09470 [Clostridium tagluense]
MNIPILPLMLQVGLSFIPKINGGLTGTGTDFLFIWLQKVGNSIFISSFIAKITSNFLDKIASCILVWSLIKSMPRQFTKDKLFSEGL